VDYAEGETATDDHSALLWLQRSADAGYLPAQVNLGIFFALGRGTNKDCKKAFHY
jgi:hypothetical protein